MNNLELLITSIGQHYYFKYFTILKWIIKIIVLILSLAEIFIIPIELAFIFN